MANEIVINSKKIEVNPGLFTGQQLYELAGISGQQQLLLERRDDIDVPILATDHIVIDGNERFSVGDGTPPIEENPCLRKPIRFYLNGEKISEDKALHRPKISGAELKALDPHSDPTDGLFADLDDLADEPIGNDFRLVIQEQDRYITTPCGNVGDAPPPDGLVGDHYQAVVATFPNAQLHVNGAGYFLLLPKIELPPEWNPRLIDMLIIIPNGYPVAGLDMFYVDPVINLADGRTPEAGQHHEVYLGRKWQRFSWHYTSRQWNPSRDSMLSHIRFCMSRFELNK